MKHKFSKPTEEMQSLQQSTIYKGMSSLINPKILIFKDNSSVTENIIKIYVSTRQDETFHLLFLTDLT